MRDMVRTCFPDADLTDPWLSPVHADLSGLPPTLIHVGSIEVLLADAELMTERPAPRASPAPSRSGKARRTSSRSSPTSPARA